MERKKERIIGIEHIGACHQKVNINNLKKL